jgi:hypothetical protein
MLKDTLLSGFTDTPAKYMGAYFGCLLIAIGIWQPLVSTSSDYTYSFYGLGMWVGYIAVVLAVLVHTFYKQMAPAIAIKLLSLSTWMLVGVLGYGLYIAKEGMSWFHYQIAIDMAAWDAVDKDAYWDLLYSLAGLERGTSVFNDLRSAYERFGAGVTINASPVFVNTINSLQLDSVKKLTSLPGSSFYVIPGGLVMMVVGLWLHFRASHGKIKELGGLPDSNESPKSD